MVSRRLIFDFQVNSNRLPQPGGDSPPRHCQSWFVVLHDDIDFELFLQFPKLVVVGLRDKDFRTVLVNFHIITRSPLHFAGFLVDAHPFRMPISQLERRLADFFVEIGCGDLKTQIVTDDQLLVIDGIDPRIKLSRNHRLHEGIIGEKVLELIETCIGHFLGNRHEQNLGFVCMLSRFRIVHAAFDRKRTIFSDVSDFHVFFTHLHLKPRRGWKSVCVRDRQLRGFCVQFSHQRTLVEQVQTCRSRLHANPFNNHIDGHVRIAFQVFRLHAHIHNALQQVGSFESIEEPREFSQGRLAFDLHLHCPKDIRLPG